MKRLLIAIAPTLFVVSVAGCAGISPEESGIATLLQIEDIATGPMQTRPAIVELSGKPAVLYSTKSDRVAIQIGDKRRLLDETARVQQGGSYFQLISSNNSIDATWWSHQSGKNIYFSSSSDAGQTFSPVSMVNDQNGVLPPYSIVRDSKGTVGAAYHDEREPGYQVYFNRSLDSGRTWNRPDQRLDTPPLQGKSSAAHEPLLVQAGATWLSAWNDEVQIDGKASYRLLAKRSKDAGIRWSAPEVLYTANHQISSLTARADGPRIVIAADALNEGIFALASNDEGQSWQRTSLLGGAAPASNSGIEFVVAGSRAHFVWMQERKDEKLRIMRASLDITQAKWLTGAKRLDTKAYENTRSSSPVIASSPQGALMAAWVDYRDIRPNIYLSASYDSGENWQAPQPLLKSGTQSAGWPQLIRWGDQMAIGYEAYPTDRLVDGKLVIQKITLGNATTGISGLPDPSQPTDVERRLKLEQRVKTLWEKRIQGDYNTAFDMFDFAYKAATPKKYYLENVGVITYLTYAIDEMSINGNEATVKTKLRYEVKPTVLPMTGKPITLQPIDVDVPNTWVWVANDWYLMYAPSFGPPTLTY